MNSASKWTKKEGEGEEKFATKGLINYQHFLINEKGSSFSNYENCKKKKS